MNSTALDRLAARAAADPFFLGFHLDRYAAAERLDDAALAARLGCPAEVLTNLRLCRAPRTDPAGFREDVTGVAARFGANPKVLAAVAKCGLAVLRHRDAPADGSGVLLAARDHDRPEGNP